MGWSGEFKDRETGEAILLDFDHVQELVDKKIDIICEDVGATAPPIIFLSNNQFLTDMENRLRKFRGEELLKYEKGFRYEVAKTKPYKGTRKNPKPFHFKNLTSYFCANFDYIISDEGLEADDEMCIYQYGREDTVICSRDKDLRICPGWHYSWECGKQRSVGPTFTDPLGYLTSKKDGSTMGYGLAFFYYQMLVGDSADNIPGLPGCGDARAKKLLEGCKTEMDFFKTVKSAYKEKLGDTAKEYFLEQANLLWMIQERGKSYELPN